MVPPDSHRISGVPCYLGIHSRGLHIRLHDSHALWSAFPDRSTSHNLYHSSINQQLDQNAPTTPNMQRLLAITHAGFGLFRFRSPLLTESQLFSLPMGTEMFHFPTFPPTTLYIQVEVARHNSGHSRFPYSDIHGSKLVYQLPMAYRRLQRPSSALDAKASTDRP